MMYLGKEKGTGKRIMFGASDGRSYNGVQRWGVSVFDFKMPKADPANPEKANVDFVGFARIPGLRSPSLVAEQETVENPKKETADSDKKFDSDKKEAANKKEAASTPTPTPKKSGTTAHKKKKKVPADDQ
jgi:hypothetical protein